MQSSQWAGESFEHAFGLDIAPKFAPTFSKNTGAPLETFDLFKMTKTAALRLKKKYDVSKYGKVVILASLDCSVASPANGKTLSKEDVTGSHPLRQYTVACRARLHVQGRSLPRACTPCPVALALTVRRFSRMR